MIAILRASILLNLFFPQASAFPAFHFRGFRLDDEAVGGVEVDDLLDCGCGADVDKQLLTRCGFIAAVTGSPSICAALV
jgi:hypothetical protein